MKAAILQKDKSFKVEDVPTPELAPDDILVKIACCGICGSDVHLLDIGLFPPGCIIGHEMSGHIAAVGEAVEGWHEGDPVVVMPLDPCMECPPCRRGDIQVCHDIVRRGYGLGMKPGGFSDFMRVKSSMLFRIPDGLDMRTAALNEPWSVALRGVNLSQMSIGEQALVMGAGPIGLLCIHALKLRGARRIYVSEPDPYRAELAFKAGVDRVFHPTKDSPGADIRKATGRGPDVVFDCAGTANSINDAVGFASRQGRVIVLGVHPSQASIFPLGCFAKEISIRFSFGYSLREFSAGLDFLARGVVDPGVVISSVMPLKEIDRAFTALHASGHCKIMIDCEASDGR